MTDEMRTILDLRLPATPDAVAQARRQIAAELTHRVAPLVLDDIQLAVSELVTNCVRHTGMEPDDWVRVHASMNRRQIRIEVTDTGPGFEPPAAPRSREDQIGGWGLYLVSQLSSRWGVERGPGNCVWFEMDHVPPEPPHASRAVAVEPEAPSDAAFAPRELGEHRDFDAQGRQHAMGH